MEDNQNYDVIYTDFAKAFDKCDHGILVHKWKDIGIAEKIGNWIYNFLKGRKQTIKVNNALSSESKVKSSVPQGTVLAPLLFLILINDIENSATHSDILSFADDTKICSLIGEINDKNKKLAKRFMQPL